MPSDRRVALVVGAIARGMPPWADLRRAIALVSHTFTVPLDEALDMDLVELGEWVGEAGDLWQRLYKLRRAR